jgi:hypothetical protein
MRVYAKSATDYSEYGGAADKPLRKGDYLNRSAVTVRLPPLWFCHWRVT